MILNVDDTSKKLMEEIRDSISGEILRKLDEYKIILKDVQENPVDISNLSEKSDIEKIKRNLDRLYENIEDIFFHSCEKKEFDLITNNRWFLKKKRECHLLFLYEK